MALWVAFPALPLGVGLVRGYKAAHEAYVLVKDQAWSRRLARYAALLVSLFLFASWNDIAGGAIGRWVAGLVG